MVPVLADTSVWVDFFNGTDTAEKKKLEEYIKRDDPVYMLPLILQEILQGFKLDADFKKAKQLLLAYPVIEYHPTKMAIQAAALYRQVRKKGMTIRKSNDCLIAAVAIKFRLHLLHRDNDFELIKKATSLKTMAV